MKQIISKAIITLDFYNNRYYKFINNKFELLSKISNKDIIVSYIANNDIIMELIELDYSIPKEHIKDVIINKIYEDLRLDTAINYGIYPIKIDALDNRAKYQVLIINKDRLKQSLKSFINKTKIKVIDYILPAPLLYKTFYINNYLTNNNADMFLYFGEKDAFVTFYYNKTYLYSKSINYSLEQIYDRICQLAQEVFISYDELLDSLKNSGLKGKNDILNKLLIHIFNECFLKLNDVLIYTKRVFNIETINKAYIGFSWGYLDGIDSYVKNYLNLKSAPISTIYTKEDPAKTIDILHTLMVMNVIDAEAKDNEVINITPYPRPLPLRKRAAGKILGAFLALILLFLVPVIYNFLMGFFIFLNNKALKIKKEKLTIKVNRYKKILQQKKEEIKALDSAIVKLKDIYNKKKGELDRVYNKKFSYKFKSMQLARITELLADYKIKSKEIKIINNIYFIELESKDDKKITAFIKKLIENFENSIKDVSLKQIYFDKQEKLYKAIVKAEFKRSLQ